MSWNSQETQIFRTDYIPFWFLSNTTSSTVVSSVVASTCGEATTVYNAVTLVSGNFLAVTKQS